MEKKFKKRNSLKEKFASISSIFSGSLSFLGGWQICHNLCLGIVAILSLIGITIAGMPLLFLNRYAVYFWLAAVMLLVPTLIMYWKTKAFMSKNIIMANIGIIIAAVPFVDLQPYQFVFWSIGGIFIGVGILHYIKNKLNSFK
jgi:hypothetical protein